MKTVSPAYMIEMVEYYILIRKGVRVRISNIMTQNDVRLLGIAFDHACVFFEVANPFYA